MDGFQISGPVLKRDRVQGQNTNERTGEVRSFDYERLRVLLDDDVVTVKVGPDFPHSAVPNKGERLHAVVTVTPYKDRTSGRAEVSITAVSPAGASLKSANSA